MTNKVRHSRMLSALSSKAIETDPQRALERLETEHFDLVISDVGMPGMRGLDLMSAIHGKKPGQLILLITAFGRIDLGVRSLQAKACGFVTKPFSIML